MEGGLQVRRSTSPCRTCFMAALSSASRVAAIMLRASTACRGWKRGLNEMNHYTHPPIIERTSLAVACARTKRPCSWTSFALYAAALRCAAVKARL